MNEQPPVDSQQSAVEAFGTPSDGLTPDGLAPDRLKIDAPTTDGPTAGGLTTVDGRLVTAPPGIQIAQVKEVAKLPSWTPVNEALTGFRDYVKDQQFVNL